MGWAIDGLFMERLLLSALTLPTSQVGILFRNLSEDSCIYNSVFIFNDL